MKRICKKCGEEKEIEEFIKEKNCYHGRGWRCKRCSNAYARKYRKSDRQTRLRREYAKKYYHTPKGKAYAIKHYQAPKTQERLKVYKQLPKVIARERKTAKKYLKKSIDTLSDVYVRSMIKLRNDIKIKDITPQMIELKRVQLKFHRELIKGKEVLNEVYSNV